MVDKKMLLEPYPVSLRAINCIKFYSQNQIQDNELLGYLFQELSYLHRHYEYHIMGNHLLENAFAMLMGGAFFKRTEWSTKAQEILKSELTEQILKDGGHFEQSPMYHNIILFRVLELIDWYSNYSEKDEQFLDFVRMKASHMVSWLKNICFENGEIPHFNDSTDGICLSLNELVQYSEELQISVQNLPLGESGYRKYKTDYYECVVDIGAIKPIYQPGHSHADSFSFWLHKDNKPIFGEKGTSTYENNKRRQDERGSSSHNTVTIDKKNQSQVWGGFRVAKQAKIKIEYEDESHILVSHNGYQPLIHSREFKFEERGILIRDFIKNQNKQIAVCHLHFAPGIEICKNKKNEFCINYDVKINFSNAQRICVKEYDMAIGFNKFVVAKKIEIEFKTQLATQIQFI
jgi:uncharacterized heparinase superfamily protein